MDTEGNKSNMSLERDIDGSVIGNEINMSMRRQSNLQDNDVSVGETTFSAISPTKSHMQTSPSKPLRGKTAYLASEASVDFSTPYSNKANIFGLDGSSRKLMQVRPSHDSTNFNDTANLKMMT